MSSSGAWFNGLSAPPWDRPSSWNYDRKRTHVPRRLGCPKRRASQAYESDFKLYDDPTFALSLSPDGKSFATAAVKNRFDLWILEGFPK
jgi:hypothetical protein